MLRNRTALCGCLLLLFVINLVVGGWSVNYLLMFAVGKTIPMIGATVIGIIVGEVSIPLAIVVAILQWAGIL